MERKRKSYLLRKSVSFNIPQQKKAPKITCTCDNASPPSRTYDLQTQTIIFGEETKQPKKFSCSSILKKFSSSPPSDNKVHQKSYQMDTDLEFYPVDDHPSPSTFTAWDAFLSGNQAFFREPPSDFSYMDVIPEEEDDLEALLESDTDDTGSSVSTVVDRFSRTSTANSSFSERGPRTDVAPFDLQKVLSPFERLEKELDAHQGQKEDDGPSRKSEVQRGPIVVITNSSSCEDVHSDADDSDKAFSPATNNHDSNLSDSQTHVDQEDNADNSTHPSENNFTKNYNAGTNHVKPSDVSVSPSVPMRTKLVNGFKSVEKIPPKIPKSDKTIPLLPPPSTPKKKSYPTPNIPPRMSLHSPARRTRSDPGTPDQPSRIPRPISLANRSNSSSSGSKGIPKAIRSPKINVPKKLVITEHSKSNSQLNQPDADSNESVAMPKNNGHIEEDDLKMTAPEILDTVEVEIAPVEEQILTSCLQNGMETEQKVNGSVNVLDETVENCLEYAICSENRLSETVVEECPSNPFGGNDTNPFRAAGDGKNPFAKSRNPFEEAYTESTPALQPKGQISAAVKAPPIPERPSLMTTQKIDKISEKPVLPATILTVSTAHVGDSHVQNDISDSLLASVPNDTGIENEFIINESLPKTPQAPDVEFESKADIQPFIEFWPTANGHEGEEVTETLKFGSQKIAVSVEAAVDALFDRIDERPLPKEALHDPQQQRPIEDILQALDQLVSAPREVEIKIDWDARGPINIREKTVVPSNASVDGSTICETDGLTEDRKRCIENLLKEVDECLRMHKVGEDTNTEETLSPVNERTSLGPGTPDVPTAGSTAPTLYNHDEAGPVIDVSSQHSSPEMLRPQNHAIVTDAQRVSYASVFQDTADHFEQDSKHHSPGCDDSGVFLEDPVASSPETQSKSAISRLQNITLQKFSPEESPQMRQYSVPEGIDSDAERSDDLGLASSSIDSADDLDGDPLPSQLQICPPVIPTRQKPPPVPARKSLPRSGDTHKQNKISLSEVMSLVEVPNYRKSPLSKSSSSGEDSTFDEGDVYTNEDQITNICFDENSRNMLNEQKTEQLKSSFVTSRSFHEDALMNTQRESNTNQESKANFLARTLSSSSPTKKFDTLNVINGNLVTRIGDHSSALKWKSEECLRTAAETKWSLPGRRFEKSVSVKDRIAMFSEMEANQSLSKKDLQRYGSETNIKAVAITADSKKADLSAADDRNQNNLSRDTKWQSLHNISKKYVEKEALNTSCNMKPALSIPSLTSNPSTESLSSSAYAPFPIKLDVEPPKPIVSTYPETQLTNNKRYNYGLYSLKNLKNTEDLLSKKAAGSNLLSIIDSRKQPLNKLKGLVIPEKPTQPDGSKALPTIFSSDTEGTKDTRRASLPITVVTTCKTMSLPRNNKLEYPMVQKQVSLSDPPWKTERSTNSISTNTLPKYSPAFKKRSLELPGSSLSPTPPSSITSPLSPPPSSPSSICSSNASSTLQQNVFQFSLSHSKPVQPLQPEKALMSPPSLPSDAEYEGDNSEDSSNSASPMRNLPRAPKEPKTAPPPPLNQGIVFYEKSNTFTTTAKPVPLQPLLVENLVKSSGPSYPQPPPRAAVCISKTEIHLRREGQKPNTSENLLFPEIKKPNEIIETCVNQVTNPPMTKTYDSFAMEYVSSENRTSESNIPENKNGSIPPDFLDGRSALSNQNGTQHLNRASPEDSGTQLEIPLGKFRACPLSLQDVKPTTNGTSHERDRDKSRDRRAVLHSECDESEDDDSHSTLSHRTEDSRHTTTDDCLSDATTDSFEKARLNPEMSASLRSVEEYASTEGYLSDASTDVSLRRFTHRPMDGNTEDYLSDVTAESPDPDWMSVRAPPTHTESRYRGYVSRNEPTGVEVDLRPKRLSQQQTVLKASIEPSGSVQKFKALAEKWEQRADVTSPPPPPVVATAPPVIKRESKPNSVSTSLFTSYSTSTTVIKGKGSCLPPSLMPRNTPSFSSERKTPSFAKLTSSHSSGSRSSPESSSHETPESNAWSHSYEEAPRAVRRDSEGSSSGSSKTTLKEEEEEAVDPAPCSTVHKTVEPTVPDVQAPPVLSNGIRNSSARQGVESWNNEPRNRRGADFTRSDWSSRTASYAAKTSVSDIRRSFENGAKEAEQPPPPKKPPVPASRAPTVTTVPPITSPRRSSSVVEEIEVQDEEVQRLVEDAKKQLYTEGVISQYVVLPVFLKREGMDGGSVGITLAGGADYEVKEITVHKVIGGSIADRNGCVLKGDRVMSINGRDVRGVSHGEALHILKAPNPRVLLVLARPVSLHHPDKAMTEVKKNTSHVQSHRDIQAFLVELQKDSTGLGFSIEGGKDSPQGDRPLLIKRVFKGGAADKEGQLEEGDEILTVNNHPVSNMTRTEAWNFLKKLPEGVVRLQIRKSNALLLS